ncbi:ABC transporter ATP-binding protein [Arthrobacter sp. GCM10027362]|uniref:ABC transporter ATP-binding protein n=1 Tax=Arthrobacter sp. GCM10027362 TaxID=3273379 RepID=UPI003633CA0D
MVCFRNVSKRYSGGQPAVENLSLDIDRGAITVFVGPSGCGKTTSLRMINRMVEPTSGTILVDGTDVARRPAAALRRTMGYVMQSSGLLPHRTVLDNIATVPRLNGVPKAQARRRAQELLDVVGLARELGRRYPAQLSGGQQQRVGVARALAADPPILLMDEPFSAVDPVVRAELQQELLRLQRQLAKTIVFVTHDIDEATVLGDKVAVFATGGRLAQFAPPAEILRAPVDNFVAAFVGRDRGFRALGFDSAAGLELEPAMTAGPGELAGAGSQGWLLLTDGVGRPVGWLPPGVRDRDAMVAGGSLFVLGSSLRQALDSALSSPSGKGVAVDASGRVAGLVAADRVLRRIEAGRTG